MTPTYSLHAADEAHRLRALRPYQLATATPDPLFDELVRLTAALFSVPMAIITLVEATTVQFRLNVGLPPGTAQERREESLCSVAILQDDTTVYENLPRDPCDLVQPGLVERLNLQFYAGHPLRTPEGDSVGILCVLDHQPRPFGEEDQALLARLAALVMALFAVQLRAVYGPAEGASLWARLCDRIEDSVTRLGTLAALAQWEDNDQTAGARAYRQSTREEIGRVLDVIEAFVQTSR